jgi:uncharacterized protein with GYD domain
MPLYMWQGAYTSEGWAVLTEKPQNRVQAVRPAIERLGGKIRSAFYCFGEFDVILIVEMPDNISAAALSMAITSGGAIRASKITVLLTPDDGLAAMKLAPTAGYTAPKTK